MIKINKKVKKYLESNKKAWNLAAGIHQQHLKKQFSQAENTGNYDFLHPQLKNYLSKGRTVKGKTVAQFCCNNGRELINIKMLGAKHCVGFDFSPELIKQAQQLTDKTNTNCEFIEANVLDINTKKFKDSFDIVFITAGSLVWIPDLTQLFLVIQTVLKKEGLLIIHEIHPLLRAIELNKKNNQLVINKPYFNRGHETKNSGVTYFPGSYPELPDQHLFLYTISDIINALIASQMKLLNFQEFPTDISYKFKNLEKDGTEIPMSYLLEAKATN